MTDFGKPGCVELWSQICDCPEGICRHFVEPASNCINRLTGEVRTLRCDACDATTWHQDGACLKCRYKGQMQL